MVTPPPLDTPADARSLDRQYVIGLCCMVVLIAAFPLYRIGEPARRAEARRAMAEESIAQGAASFERHCIACHGPGGRGGSIAPTLAAKEFLSVTADQQLTYLIAAGVPGTTMPPYHLDFGGPFTEQEIARIVRYLRSLEPGASSAPNWRAGEKVAPRSEERSEDRSREHRDATRRDDHRP